MRVLASDQCVPGLILTPGIICGVEFLVCSLLCSERFIFQVLQFSTLLKNENFQIPIGSWNAQTFLNKFVELLGAPWVNYINVFLKKQITCTVTILATLRREGKVLS